jgi:hypothetical protein
MMAAANAFFIVFNCLNTTTILNKNPNLGIELGLFSPFQKVASMLPGFCLQ